MLIYLFLPFLWRRGVSMVFWFILFSLFVIITFLAILLCLELESGSNRRNENAGVSSLYDTGHFSDDFQSNLQHSWLQNLWTVLGLITVREITSDSKHGATTLRQGNSETYNGCRKVRSPPQSQQSRAGPGSWSELPISARKPSLHHHLITPTPSPSTPVITGHRSSDISNMAPLASLWLHFLLAQPHRLKAGRLVRQGLSSGATWFVILIVNVRMVKWERSDGVNRPKKKKIPVLPKAYY